MGTLIAALMSFYTSLTLYRPTPPPVVLAPELAEFVAAFWKLGFVQPGSGCSLLLKYGSAIDQDDRPADEEILRIGVSILRRSGAAWEVDDQYEDLEALANSLQDLSENRPIYRAELSLGSAVPAGIEGLQRVASPENEIDLQFDTWSLTLGPVYSFHLAGEASYQVGWIGLNLSGYGYLFPWTFRDLAERVFNSARIAEAVELCRGTWPVTEKLSAQRIENRRLLGELWPHPLDVPLDWAWGLAESG